MPRTPIEQFTGLDNRNPQFNVALNGLLEGDNVYVDDERRIKRRDGYTLQTAGNFHSLWSNVDRDLAFVVEDSDLKQVNADLSLTTIVSGLLGAGKMSYVETVRGTVVYSNGVDIGRIVAGVNTPFDAPLESYKQVPQAGHLLAWLNSRLYIAIGGIVWFTDAYTYNVDRRVGLMQFNSYINLLQAVDDGLYIGDSERTYFVKNDPPSKVTVHEYPAYVHSWKASHSELFSIDGLPFGKTLVWGSEEGLIVGGNGGAVFNVTRDHYTMPSAGRGGGLIAESNGNYHYVVNLFT